MSIKSDTIKIKGKLSFMHLLKADDFNGRSAPKYKFRLTPYSPKLGDISLIARRSLP